MVYGKLFFTCEVACCIFLLFIYMYFHFLFIFAKTGAAMQESIRFASSGDDVKIWDSSSLTVVEQFNPHTPPHPVSSLCWASNSILYSFSHSFVGVLQNFSEFFLLKCL